MTRNKLLISCSFALDTISQLDRDTSTALATIREWRNSFAPINRIPLDILSLIPEQLLPQERLRVTFVCRHWRRAFLQHGTLWSRISLHKGEAYTKTLLQRAKGSTLDISINQDVPISTMALLSPRTHQIECLAFKDTPCLEAVRRFSEVNSGPLPFLRTLIVELTDPTNMRNQPVMPAPPPFFSNAVNLEQFSFHANRLRSLNQFVFPNLTVFSLLVRTVPGSNTSGLFHFLKVSPLLQSVQINVIDEIFLEEIDQEVPILLPHVETFVLRMYGSPNVYGTAARISCPHARYTSLTCNITDTDMWPEREVFPTPDLTNTIVHQYAKGPVEEVTLEMSSILEQCCSLTFRSPDASTVKLVFEVSAEVSASSEEDGLDMTFEEIAREGFCQGIGTIRDHPQLSHVNRLHIRHRDVTLDAYHMFFMTFKVEELFESVGPLDELTINGCDLCIYFPAIPGEPYGSQRGRIAFPSIKTLTILHPSMEEYEEEYTNAVVELAELQHMKGIPFERVMVRAEALPAAMEDRLRPWVGIGDCCEEVRP